MVVAEIYNIIGSSIVSNISDRTWESAQLEIEGYINDYVQFSGSYTTRDGKTIDIDAHHFDSNELESAVYELKKIMMDGGHNRWNKAVFKVWPNNKFDMEFIWDQELDDQINS